MYELHCNCVTKMCAEIIVIGESQKDVLKLFYLLLSIITQVVGFHSVPTIFGAQEHTFLATVLVLR